MCLERVGFGFLIGTGSPEIDKALVFMVTLLAQDVASTSVGPNWLLHTSTVSAAAAVAVVTSSWPAFMPGGRAVDRYLLVEDSSAQ